MWKSGKLMMQEALLIFACTNNTGCSPTLATYAHYNMETVKNYEQIYAKVYKTVPNALITYVFPILSVLNKQKATLKLTNELITEVNNENMSISYVIEY